MSEKYGEKYSEGNLESLSPENSPIDVVIPDIEFPEQLIAEISKAFDVLQGKLKYYTQIITADYSYARDQVYKAFDNIELRIILSEDFDFSQEYRERFENLLKEIDRLKADFTNILPQQSFNNLQEVKDERSRYIIFKSTYNQRIQEILGIFHGEKKQQA